MLLVHSGPWPFQTEDWDRCLSAWGFKNVLLSYAKFLHGVSQGLALLYRVFLCILQSSSFQAEGRVTQAPTVILLSQLRQSFCLAMCHTCASLVPICFRCLSFGTHLWTRFRTSPKQVRHLFFPLATLERA